MRLAEAALPTSGAEGVPWFLAMRAIKTAMLAKKTTVKILRYVEKKLSEVAVSMECSRLKPGTYAAGTE